MQNKITHERTQEDRRERTRSALLESAIAQIARHGLQSCKLVDIVRSANVTTGAVQHLFGNRDALILESIKEIFRRTALRASSLPRTGGIEERLIALVDYRSNLVGQDLSKALLDIVVNSRYETELGHRIRKLLKEQSRESEAWFLLYMSDLGIAERRLIVVERSLASSLYGLEILNKHRWTVAEYREILEYTMRAHISYLTGDEGD